MAHSLQPRVSPSLRQQWGLQGYWFSFNFQGSALLTIVVPETVLRFSGRASHTGLLAQIATLVALAAMIMSPLTGVWSDKERRQHGRRIGLLWWGTGFNVAGLIGAIWAHSFVVMSSCIITAILGQTAAQSAYQAMMPEVVPRQRWGRASGYMGLASLSGSIAGLGIAGFLAVDDAYAFMAATALAGALLTTWAVPAKLAHSNPGHAVVRNHDIFVRVFMARFALMFGQTLLMTYVLYFFRDVLHEARPAAGTAVIAGLAMVGAVVSTVLLGIVSDRAKNRAGLVAMAGIPMATAALGFSLWPKADWLPLWALLYGAGYGAVLSVDWALALDSIPDLGNVARDLGIWGIASGLPPVLAPAVGGWVLAWSLPLASRYRILFLLAGLTFVVGSLIVLTARKQPLPREWSWPLAGLVLCLLLGYTRLRYRIFLSGRLAREAPSLLVVANHAHDLEGMVVPAAVARLRGIRKPVISAGSARIFEPGFMTERIPGRVSRFFARWNIGSIMRLLGVRPIEDHPLSRPLASWAYLVFKNFGNLSMSEVFESRYIPPGMAGEARLSACWTPRHIRACRGEATISALTATYRSWVRDHVRAQVEDEMAVFHGLLRRGYAVYTTPEGRFSEDGHLHRFRKSLDLMRAASGSLCVVGVSYDVFWPGKLTMLVNFESPRWPANLEESIIAARPITACHLVIQAWLGRPHVHYEEIIDEALMLLRRVQGQAVLSPDLRHEPVRVLREVLQELLRRSQQGGPVTDPRFPFVPDFIAYYSNQWTDLLRVLERAIPSERRGDYASLS